MKLEKGSIKYLIVIIITMIIAGLIIYPLFDLIIAKIFTHSDFVYNISDHLIDPIIYGTITGIIYWVIDKKRK